MRGGYHGLNPDEDLPSEIPVKEMYVRSPPRLIRSAYWVAMFDLLLTGLVWFWAEGWNGGDFWEHQVTDYRFDSSAIEVVLLAVVRLVVLMAVLLRSRACLVRVNGDGRIKPSPEAMVAFVVCASCAAYCVFKRTPPPRPPGSNRFEGERAVY